MIHKFYTANRHVEHFNIEIVSLKLYNYIAEAIDSYRIKVPVTMIVSEIN